MSEDFEERAAILEHDAKMPREWAEALARIDTALVPAGYTAERWAVVVDDAGRLLGRWLGRIRASDWTPADIRGLLPLLAGREVVAVGAGDVTVIGADGVRVKLYRRPVLNGPSCWQEGRRAA